MATAELAFPTASTRPEEQDEASEDDIPIRDLVNRRRNQPDPAAKSNCPGCRRHMASGRREHTRVPGECRYPDVEPEPEWTCPGCIRVPPRDRIHADHNNILGECRWASADTWASSTKNRRGGFPREGRVSAADDPYEGIRGSDLNTEDPPRPPAGGTAPALAGDEGPAGRGSGEAIAGSSGDRHGDEDPVGRRSSEVVAGSSGDRHGSGRNPEQGPRQMAPRAVARAAGGSPGSDWTSFDVNYSLRMLRTGTEAQQRREIKNLHIRWWHATRVQMERVLNAAGVPREVLEMVPDVVDTCRECRAWQRPKQEPAPSVELTMKQNDQVQGDIMFYKQHLIWHMVDRAERWQAAIEVPNKTTGALCDAITKCWIQIHGPFRCLVIDGERVESSQKARKSSSAGKA